ncbi:hypothetical protein D3C83_323220 [compost metagenome]
MATVVSNASPAIPSRKVKVLEFKDMQIIYTGSRDPGSGIRTPRRAGPDSGSRVLDLAY